MHRRDAGITLAGALLFFLVLCGAPSVKCADSDVLLEFAAATKVPYPSWNAQNTSQMCLWEGITCDGDGRVIRLSIYSEKSGSPILFGTIPPSIVQLDHLQDLSLDRNYLTGTVPIGLFNLPVIRSISVSRNGLTIDFPASVSPTLQELFVSDSYIRTALPEMNWANLTYFDVSSTTAKCPLPAGFVAHFKAGGTISRCTMEASHFTIDDAGIACGQIDATNTTCHLLAHSYQPPYFDTDTRPANVDLRVEFGNTTMEFIKNEVFFFAAYNNSKGERIEYRQEYISFKYYPIFEEYDMPETRKFHTFEMIYFENFVWDSPTHLRVNFTAMAGGKLILELIFDFGQISHETGKEFIKFSYALYNIGYTWKNSDAPLDERGLSINFVVTFKMQHSPVEGPPTVCKVIDFITQVCQSPVATMKTYGSLLDGGHILSVTTKNVSMMLSLPIAGTIDGRVLSGVSGNMHFYTSRNLHPFPNGNWFEVFSESNLTADSLFGIAAPVPVQSVTLPVSQAVPRVQRVLFYDPDISISLLFDPPGMSPESIVVPVVVSIVVVVVVIIAGVTVFAKVIFPYMHRESTTTELMMSEESNSHSCNTNNWKRVDPSNTSVA